MPDIQRLDSQTSQRIAAGEVVERPASVIKELVENAIDAGATAISVEIQEGGIAVMRVTDNGCGIPSEQVRVAFERHATSKIRDIGDLDRLDTLGFRGEALYAIAAVSQVTMLTRTPQVATGVQVTVTGGTVGDVVDAGCPQGTTVTVTDLFYNTPARLKFLKKPQSEASAIGDMMTKLMLSHPQLSIRYVVAGKTVFHSPGNGQLLDAIYTALGRQAAGGMLPVALTEGHLRVHGYVGIPDLARGNRAQQYFFVNGRYVQNPQMAVGLEKGGSTRMPPGKHAVAVLFLELPPHLVDVNVHPHKAEVRYAAGIDAQIVPLVAQGVAMALAGAEVASLWGPAHQDRPTVQAAGEEQPAADTLHVFAPVTRSMPAHVRSTIPQEPGRLGRVAESGSAYCRSGSDTPVYQQNPPRMPLPDSPKDGQLVVVESRAVREQRKATPEQPFMLPEEVSRPVALPVVEEQTVLPPMTHPFVVIGQVFSLYVLVQEGDTLWMVDQHAAHERMLYERFTQAFQAGDVVVQDMLLPVTVDLTPAEMEQVEVCLPLLSEMGFVVEPFGPLSVRLTAVPLFFAQPQAQAFLREWLDGLERFMKEPVDVKRDTLARMACRTAVKGGDVLQQAEMEALLARIRDEDTPLTCPHGRPILIKITKHELERRFRRV